MEISLNWLKRYVELPESTRVISEALTSLGFEVEGIRQRGADVKGVVVGEVRECGKHPDAEKLSLCKVYDGIEEVPVVCGAPNVAKGQKVLFARVGAELAGGLIIKKAKLRGVESFGMLCGEDEVGLGDSHDGIVVLDSSTPVGVSMQDVPGLCDVVFEINVTPNRPDALGHLGVARELAARFKRTLQYPDQNSGAIVKEDGSDISGLVSLKVEDQIGCSRYVGRVVEGITVGPSPAWLVSLLKSMGKKSINNVVDLTNFVLLEWGQPSHAFDLHHLAGRKIVVRRAHSGETLKTLDGVERKLDDRDLVIADRDKPQVLAGVMGGEESGVTATTRNVFIEVACFDPKTVRTQSRRHVLQSDSSYRFERGVDPLATARVCDYIAALIARWCGGHIASGRVESVSSSHPKKAAVVPLRPARVETLLGISITDEEIETLLARIEVNVAGDDGDETVLFEVPGFRGDLEREVDLIEEVARLLDYNTLPSTLPVFPLRAVALPPGEVLASKIKHTLADLGLSETLSLRFTSRKAIDRLNLSENDTRRNFVPLQNPLSDEWELLPTTPLPALLQALERNQNMQEQDVRLFEVGRAFFKRDRNGDLDSGVREVSVLGIALLGEWKENAWDGSRQPVDFLRLKGVVENLLEALRIDLDWKFGSTIGFVHPIESAELFAADSNEPLAVLGTLHPKVQSEYGLKNPAVVAEFDLEALLRAPRRAEKFVAYESQTGTTRDVNVVVTEKIHHADVLASLPKNSENLREVRLNSVYRGKGLPEGHKALHYSFIYRHTERTLTDEEVNKTQENIVIELLKNPAIQIK